MEITPLLGDGATLLRRPYHDSEYDSVMLTFSTLCLCCRDLVGSLDKDKRVRRLAFGYIRENCEYYFHDDLTKQCLKFLGNAANFDERQLRTLKELDEHWYRTDSCLCTSKRRFCRALSVLLAIVIFLLKDAVALYIDQTDDECTWSESSKYSALDLSLWLLIAAFAHIFFATLILFALTPLIWDVGRDLNWNFHKFSYSYLLRRAWDAIQHGETAAMPLFGATPVIVLCWCFLVVWIVFGCSLWAELDASAAERAQSCFKMVEYWLALQSIELLILPSALLYISCSVFTWNFGDGAEKLCFVSILFAVLVFFVAKDIAALVINFDNDCDQALSDGVENSFVAFTINTWMLGGSLSHLTVCLCTWMWWCVASFNVTDLMEIGLAGMVCGLMLPWCFFIAWTVIGFLLYSEMDGNTDCAKMTLSWSTIEAVEVLIPCLVYMAANMDGVNWSLFVRSFCALSLFAAKDIAALVIVQNDDCDAALEGDSTFVSFGVSTWMLAGSASHAATCGGLFVFAVVDAVNDRPGDCLCAAMAGFLWLPWLFYTAWSVVGFLLYSEMDSDASCSKMTLAWSIIEGIEVLVACYLVFVSD